VAPDFDAVGRYYDVFAQTTDEEVLELLRAGAGRGDVKRET
jgi:predicted phosphoribosyltransferase